MTKSGNPDSICINYIEYGVTDIERAKEFYGGALGWTFIDYGTQYCEFNDGQMKGGFELTDAPSLGGALIVLYHDDLEKVKNKIIAAGGTITQDIFQFPGGERFQFTDLDGHELAGLADCLEMAISSEHIAYLEDLFSVVDGASIRKMFGGVGIF